MPAHYGETIYVERNNSPFWDWCVGRMIGRLPAKEVVDNYAYRCARTKRWYVCAYWANREDEGTASFATFRGVVTHQRLLGKWPLKGDRHGPPVD